VLLLLCSDVEELDDDLERESLGFCHLERPGGYLFMCSGVLILKNCIKKFMNYLLIFFINFIINFFI
jgi:hypothetical protein